MGINDEGLELIKEYEGLHRVVSDNRIKPYKCAAGYPTVGYGAIYARSGERVKMSDSPISKVEAEYLLRRDCNIAYRAVERLAAPYTEDLTENQMAALTSLCFNIGAGNFRASTVRSNIVRGSFENAGNNFWQWRRGGPDRRILPGLVRRRAREKQLFFS
jgi:GH24 family phage-related lysozyme (muramidase)